MSAQSVVADTLLNEGCGDSDQCDKTAARVLSALAAAGYAVVPREPTQRMLDHAWDHGDENARDVWTAMLAKAAKDREG